MRRAPALAVLVAILALAGCTAEPVPEPERTASASQKPTPTPTPTPESVVAPTPAFDVTCADVQSALTPVLGAPSTPAEPVLSTVSSPGWYPGPAQHMFAFAGGLACSAGDPDRWWEVTIMPGAQSLIDGATERHGFAGEQARCEGGYVCVFEIRVGDVLLSASISDRGGLDDSAAAALDESLRAVAARAAETLREIELAASDIIGAPCERFLSAQELQTMVGQEVVVQERYGGWGIPAEVYHVVNGSRICSYRGTDGDEYSASAFATITMLPAGAWAFEEVAGDPAEFEGADAAKTSVDVSGRSVVDLQIGPDWVRITSNDPALDLDAVTEQVVRTLTVGRIAPQ